MTNLHKFYAIFVNHICRNYCSLYSVLTSDSVDVLGTHGSK